MIQKPKINSIFFTLVLCVLCLLPVNVWAGKVTGNTSVESGKGTVKVQMEVWYLVGGWKFDSEGASTSSTDVSTVTLDNSSTKRCKFVVVSTETGYTFSGWYKTDGNLKSSNPEFADETVTAGVDRTYTYFARFAPNNYTITLDNQSATTPGTANIAVTFDANTNLTATPAITVPEKSGKVFDGYYTQANGSGVRIIDGAGRVLANTSDASYSYTDADRNWVRASDVTLFANWVSQLTPSITCGKTTLEVEEELTDAFTFINTDGLTWEIKDVDVAALNNGDGKVIEYDAANNIIKAHNAGTATIVFHQPSTATIKAADIEIDFTVNRRTPEFTWNSASTPYFYQSKIHDVFESTSPCNYTFSSSNSFVAEAIKGVEDTLMIYNVEETTTITVTQEENYKWFGKSQGYIITPVDPYNHVPFDLTSSNRTTYGEVMSGEAKWEDNGYAYGNGSWGVTGLPEGYTILHFTGLPDTIRFVTSCVPWGLNYPEAGDYLFEVYESDNGIDWNRKWACDNSKKYTASEYKNATIKVALSPSSTYVKLRYEGTCWGKIQDIHVGELNKFQADVTAHTLDFGTYGAKYGTQELPLNFTHANAGRITSVEILPSADAACFSVSPDAISGTGRDLYGTRTLRVSFNNNDAGRSTDYTATLRISDNIGHIENVTLKGHREGKTHPSYTWNSHHLPYFYGSVISYVAASNNTDYTHCPLSYETTDASIAYVDSEGNLHIGEKNEAVTITVRQVNGNAYFEAGSATFTFTPRPRPSLNTPFFLTSSIFESDAEVSDASRCGWEDSDGGRVHLGNNNIFVDDWNWDIKSFTLIFDGDPDKLSFDFKNSFPTATVTPFEPHMWEVFESANGSDWTSVWSYDVKKDSYMHVDVALKESTRFLQFFYRGNYSGWWKNISVSALDGVKYLYKDGKYLSRGGSWGTQAVIDEFGTPLRITRYTKDNTIDTTLVQFVDSRQYLYEAGENTVFTDNITAGNSNIRWIQTLGANTISLSNGVDKYITVNSAGKLAITNVPEEVTVWKMVDYTTYGDSVQKMMDEKAALAASHLFGPEVNTLNLVRSKITENDLELMSKDDIPHKNDHVYEVDDSGRSVTGMPAVYDNTISNLLPGFYRLTVQALYQTASYPTDWQNNEAGMESVIAYIYANDVKYPIKSRYDVTGQQDHPLSGSWIQGGEKWYAADGTAAQLVFEANQNAYINDVYVYIAADPGKTTGTLNYGIVNPSYVEGEWLAFENITLTFIARKEYIYKTTADTKWDKLSNWEYKGAEPVSTPTINHAIIIKSDMVVDDGELQAYSITIDPGAHVTVAPTGGIKVREGGIINATKDNFKLQASTSGANKGQTGYLRISPDYNDPMPQATVELYSIAYFDMNGGKPDNNAGAYQYVGSPLAAGTAAKEVFKSSWIYNWDETSGAWKNNRKTLTLEPFVGYATSQYKDENGILISNKGQLASNSDQLLNLTYTSTSAEPGINVLANSYTAPIDITKFELSDFSDGVEAAIYIFNTGSANDTAAARISGDVNAPGQFLSIPVKTAIPLGYPAVIPSMQGFYVKTTKDGTLTLDYQRLVWEATESNKPLRAPSRQDEETIQTLCVTLSADGWHDNVYLLQSDNYETAFENGYDAHKIMNGNLNIFTIEDEDYLSVDATNNIIGTRIGVRTGEETAYTMCFGRVSDDKWSLYDAETGNNIAISDGAQYTFFAEPNSTYTNRFYIIERVSVCTGINETQIDNSARKFIKEGQLFILKNGVLYNTMGNLVREL